MPAVFIRFILIFLLLPAFTRGYCQSTPVPPNAPASAVAGLSTDRPGVANATNITPVGSFLLESGFEYYRQPGTSLTHLPTCTFRTGLNDRLEARVTAGILRQGVDSASRERAVPVTGAAALTVGSKIALCQARGWRPGVGLQVELAVPRTGHQAFRSKYMGNSLLLLLENDLSDRLNLNYNLGMSWSGGEPGGTALYALCFNYQASPAVSLFAEHYGYWPEGGAPAPNLDGGMSLALTPNVQVDFSGGVCLRGALKPYFLASGLSIRFNRRPVTRPHP